MAKNRFLATLVQFYLRIHRPSPLLSFSLIAFRLLKHVLEPTEQHISFFIVLKKIAIFLHKSIENQNLIDALDRSFLTPHTWLLTSLLRLLGGWKPLTQLIFGGPRNSTEGLEGAEPPQTKKYINIGVLINKLWRFGHRGGAALNFKGL